MYVYMYYYLLLYKMTEPPVRRGMRLYYIYIFKRLHSTRNSKNKNIIIKTHFQAPAIYMLYYYSIDMNNTLW